MFRLITLIVLFGIVATISGNKPLHHPLAEERINVQPTADESYRLPGNTIPEKYDLTLTTNIDKENFDFLGHVIITIKVVTVSNRIVLHSKLVAINEVKVNYAVGGVLIGSTFSFDIEKDFLFIDLDEAVTLTVDDILTLDIKYSGTLRDDNAGFYRSSYKPTEGTTRWLATTQFESTDARHALPCYDEPHLKAIFKVTIIHGEAYHAISNMEVLSESAIVDGMKTTIFQDTPLMSSYLLAFIVSDFVFVESTTGILPKQKVFAQQALVDKLQFSLDSGVAILKAFEDYFEVSYDLPKLDQAAIPDFAAGAMENWGMVTYREEYLIHEEDVSSDRQKELIATIIAHEYAHQWFGDLVSPEWWKFIWLNEGFATYYENFMADKVYPEMKLMDTYVTSVVQYSFGPDALNTTRVMSHDAQTPSEISGLFDNIAYDKSGCVIRMMQHALTEPVFRGGITEYLRTRSLKEANEQHLFDSLKKAAQVEPQVDPLVAENMVEIFESWSQQKGYPLITVTRNYTTGEILLTQKKFLLKQDENDKTLWWVPFNYMSKTKNIATNTAPMGWMDKNIDLIIKPNDTTFGTISNDDWVIFNKQQTGYYRVNYDMDNWHLLMTELETNRVSINPINRAQIIDDSFHLARAGIAEYHVPFKLINYLKNETDYLPWAAASNSFSYLNRVFAGSSKYSQLQTLFSESVESLYTKMGTEDKAEDHLDKYTRNIAINWACSLGLSDCLDKTKIAVTEFLNNGTAVNGNLRSVMYCNGLRLVSEDLYDKMLNKLNVITEQNERTIIINALGCSESDTLLDKYLKSIFATGSTYRKTEKSRAIPAVYNSGPNGIKAAITFIKENAKAIVDTFNSRTLGSYLTNIASRIVTADQKSAFDALLADDKVIAEIDASVKTTCDAIIKDTQDWIDNNQDSIETYLTSVYGSASTVVVSVVAFIATLFITFNNLF